MWQQLYTQLQMLAIDHTFISENIPNFSPQQANCGICALGL